MACLGPVRRWDIFWADLDPGVGSEQRGVYPFEVLLPAGTFMPEHASIVMRQQIRSISKRRLLDKVGAPGDPERQAGIENRLLEHLGIQFEAEDLDGR